MIDYYQEAESLIKKVLDGIEPKVDISLMVSPSDAVSILRKFEADNSIGEMETNGWQWDFWTTFVYKEQKYTLSGSGYYGELEFRKGADNE